MGFDCTRGVGRVNLRERLGPIGQLPMSMGVFFIFSKVEMTYRQKSSDTSLIVAEEDEAGCDNQADLSNRQLMTTKRHDDLLKDLHNRDREERESRSLRGNDGS